MSRRVVLAAYLRDAGQTFVARVPLARHHQHRVANPAPPTTTGPAAAGPAAGRSSGRRPRLSRLLLQRQEAPEKVRPEPHRHVVPVGAVDVLLHLGCVARQPVEVRLRVRELPVERPEGELRERRAEPAPPLPLRGAIANRKANKGAQSIQRRVRQPSVEFRHACVHACGDIHAPSLPPAA
jgi:hypothetical protein